VKYTSLVLCSYSGVISDSDRIVFCYVTAQTNLQVSFNAYLDHAKILTPAVFS